MRYLITGHTGFKGSWLSIVLKELGHEVHGISLDAHPESLFHSANIERIIDGHCILDIRNKEQTIFLFERIQPDMVIHLAAQSLVLESYANPVNTYETNIIGTLNSLIATQNCNTVKGYLGITSDKVYKQKDINSPHSENDVLEGYDPYSYSKVMADMLMQSWHITNSENNFSILSLGIARAGNVIGGGDYSRNRLVPDLIESVKMNTRINLRFPDSVRPWQHVLDCLSGYIKLSDRLIQGKCQGAWNFGPKINEIKTVSEFSNEFYSHFGKKNFWNSIISEKTETNFLSLNSSKAKTSLDWEPKLNFSDSVSLTANWYKKVMNNTNVLEATLDDINYYFNL